MKGARALVSGLVFLAAACAVPAVSAAQESDSPADTTTTATTTTLDQAFPPDAAAPTEAGSGAGEPASSDQAAADQASAPQPAVTVSGPDTAGRAHASASASVSIVDFAFSPASVTIAVGDTVTWHNTGQAPHNATADDGSFKTPDLNNGQSASHRFSSAGTFTYICSIHPFMHGTVRVLSASGGSSKGGSGGSAGSSSSSGSNLTEEQAVASPDAAGNSTTLPMTGMAAGALALVGAVLLGLGLVARLAATRPL